MAQIDINDDGELDNVARLFVSSSAGCGFDDDWLQVINQDFTKFSDSLININDSDYPLGGRARRIYKFDDKFYVETFKGFIPNGVVHLQDDTYKQICKFDEIRDIGIAKFFDFDNY